MISSHLTWNLHDLHILNLNLRCRLITLHQRMPWVCELESSGEVIIYNYLSDSILIRIPKTSLDSSSVITLGFAEVPTGFDFADDIKEVTKIENEWLFILQTKRVTFIGCYSQKLKKLESKEIDIKGFSSICYFNDNNYVIIGTMSGLVIIWDLINSIIISKIDQSVNCKQITCFSCYHINGQTMLVIASYSPFITIEQLIIESPEKNIPIFKTRNLSTEPEGIISMIINEENNTLSALSINYRYINHYNLDSCSLLFSFNVESYSIKSGLFYLNFQSFLNNSLIMASEHSLIVLESNGKNKLCNLIELASLEEKLKIKEFCWSSDHRQIGIINTESGVYKINFSHSAIPQICTGNKFNSFQINPQKFSSLLGRNSILVDEQNLDILGNTKCKSFWKIIRDQIQLYSYCLLEGFLEHWVTTRLILFENIYDSCECFVSFSGNFMGILYELAKKTIIINLFSSKYPTPIFSGVIMTKVDCNSFAWDDSMDRFAVLINDSKVSKEGKIKISIIDTNGSIIEKANQKVYILLG